MQTLSRYFVAFLLVLVSSFLEDETPEQVAQRASAEKKEVIIEVSGPSETHQILYYRCS